jgi:hypothetical protein
VKVFDPLAQVDRLPLESPVPRVDVGPDVLPRDALLAQDPPFPTITPHDLRHTAASLAVSAGANVKAVQRMLGHAKAPMTLDVYADLFDSDLDDVAVNMDTAIRAAVYPLSTGGSEIAPSANT